MDILRPTCIEFAIGNIISDILLYFVNAFRLKFLRRQAKCLNLASKRLLSSALIQCHMDYACSSWYHGLQKNLKHKLQILQNKTIRFVLDLTPRSHIGYSEFNRVNWLPVRFRVQQIVSTNMHRLIHGNAPLYLREGISMVQERHSYNTRNSVLSLILPRVNSSGDKSFSYIAATSSGTSYQSPFEQLKTLYISAD